MGGAAPVESGKGRKKALDSELNLVPFIDLLSCLISFLLITAVWTNISAVQARMTGSLTDVVPPPDEIAAPPVHVTVTASGYTLRIGSEESTLPKAKAAASGATPGLYDARDLAERLKKVQSQFSAFRAVTIAAEDSVQYEDLIGTLDAISMLGIKEISVSPAN